MPFWLPAQDFLKPFIDVALINAFWHCFDISTRRRSESCCNICRNLPQVELIYTYACRGTVMDLPWCALAWVSALMVFFHSRFSARAFNADLEGVWSRSCFSLPFFAPSHTSVVIRSQRPFKNGAGGAPTQRPTHAPAESHQASTP